MKVYLPIFSKLQDEREKFRELFFKVTALTAWATFLLTGVLIIGAELLIVTLFGEKWLPSVRIFQVMMFSFFNYPINALLINAMLAKGLVKRNLYYGLIRSAIRMAPLAIAWIYGFEAFLYAFVVASYIGTLLNNILIGKDLEFSFSRQLKEFYRWLFVLIVAIAPAIYFYTTLEEQLGATLGAKWIATLSAELIFIVLYLVLSRLVQPSLQTLVFAILHPLYKRFTS